MFKSLRLAARSLEAIERRLEALETLGEMAVHALSTPGDPGAEMSNRVAALERELERRHAEAEGLLLKAKGKLDASRAAEERARRLAESAGRAEDGEEISEEELREAYAAAGLQLEHGEGSEEEGVQPLRRGVARRHASKQNALAMKYARR